MKAKPLRQIGNTYEPCLPDEATHLRLSMPCPISDRILPVVIKGDRRNSPCWTWNGDTEKPTLKPSILTNIDFTLNEDPPKVIPKIVCHSFVTDGKVQFLSDSTHEFAGQTLDLLDVE